MACTTELGMMWSRKSLNCRGAPTLAPDAAAVAESPRPGLNSCTAARPIVMETSVAITNHPRAFAPILAIAAAPSMRATPTTSVENTNGAMIILMRRRKLVVMREKTVAALSAAGPLPRTSCNSNPNSGPVIMAIMTNQVRRDFMLYF